MSSSQPNCFLSAYFQVSLDVVGLVDEWAARFFEELDYVNEGENGNLFAEMMKKDLPQVSVISPNVDFCCCHFYYAKKWHCTIHLTNLI